MINEDALKQRIQRWIVCGSVAIMAGKFLAFWLTNSVGILTDAVESIVNVTAGFISLYSLYLAAKPKDAGHPFGHGKVELISASIEGLLIIIAGGVIIFEGVRRLFEPAGNSKTRYRHHRRRSGRSNELPDGVVQHPHGAALQFDSPDSRGQTPAIGHLFDHRARDRPDPALHHPYRLDRQCARADFRRDHHPAPAFRSCAAR